MFPLDYTSELSDGVMFKFEYFDYGSVVPYVDLTNYTTVDESGHDRHLAILDITNGAHIL